MQIIGSLSARNEFEFVTLANTSQKRVSYVRLGWVIYDRAHRWEPNGMAFLGHGFDVNIGADQVYDARGTGISATDTIELLNHDHIA